MICIWSALFIEVWQRNNATLSYQWDCDVYEEAEPDRPEFFGTTQIMVLIFNTTFSNRPITATSKIINDNTLHTFYF